MIHHFSQLQLGHNIQTCQFFVCTDKTTQLCVCHEFQCKAKTVHQTLFPKGTSERDFSCR